MTKYVIRDWTGREIFADRDYMSFDEASEALDSNLTEIISKTDLHILLEIYELTGYESKTEELLDRCFDIERGEYFIEQLESK